MMGVTETVPGGAIPKTLEVPLMGRVMVDVHSRDMRTALTGALLTEGMEGEPAETGGAPLPSIETGMGARAGGIIGSPTIPRMDGTWLGMGTARFRAWAGGHHRHGHTSDTLPALPTGKGVERGTMGTGDHIRGSRGNRGTLMLHERHRGVAALQHLRTGAKETVKRKAARETGNVWHESCKKKDERSERWLG
jgi:hypothetical protein